MDEYKLIFGEKQRLHICRKCVTEKCLVDWLLE